MKNISKKLLQEYKNPILFLDPSDYAKLRKRFVRISLLGYAATTYFIVSFIVIAVTSDGTDLLIGPRSEGSVQAVNVLMATILPILSTYRLLTLRQAIVSLRRDQLVWLHPELKVLEPSKGAVRTYPIGVRLAAYTIFILLLVGGIMLWALHI